MDYFPRGEVGAAELGTFEIGSENGIYSESDIAAAGQSVQLLLGAALASSALASAGTASTGLIGAGLTQALMSVNGQSVVALATTRVAQVALSSAGSASQYLEGVTFQPRMPLGNDPMNRTAEGRSMARPGESRAMEEIPAGTMSRPGEQRGITK